jgi:hypothetical protein
LSRSARLASLSPSQGAQLCIWLESKIREAGPPRTCPSTKGHYSLQTIEDCRKELVDPGASKVLGETCPATVADFQDCVQAIVDSPCDNGSPHCGIELACGLERAMLEPPAIGKDVRVTALNASQWGQICDWSTNLHGGYGKTVQCNGFKSTWYASREDCVQGVALSPSCTATWSNLEACFWKTAQEPCTILPAGCEWVLDCARR